MIGKLIKFSIAVLFAFAFIQNSSSSSCFELTNEKYAGFIIRNSSKWCLGQFGKYDHDIQPGGIIKYPSDSSYSSYGWRLRSSIEPYFDIDYYFILSSPKNVLTIKDHNSGINGYPWTMTKIGTDKNMVVNVSSNCGNEVYVSLNAYNSSVYKLPAKISIDPKKVYYRASFYIKHNNKVYFTGIIVPYGFKGGIYDLKFELNSDPKTIVSMTNDEKHYYKLEGCEGLEGINYWFSKDYINKLSFFPSGYEGRIDIGNLVYSDDLLANGSSTAYSSKYSYNISYHKQFYPRQYDSFNVLKSEEKSDKTEITVGNYFEEDLYIDVYKKESMELLKTDLKHYVADDNKGVLFRLRNKSGTIYIQDDYAGGGYKTTVNVGFVNEFTSKTIYKTKGFQFFENEKYFLSGLILNKGNPIKIIDGKMNINPKTYICEIDGKVVKDDTKTLTMTAKLSGSKNLSTIVVDKEKFSLSIDGKDKHFDGKISIIDDEIYIPLESLAKLLGCKTKYYSNEKSLCLTYKYQ